MKHKKVKTSRTFRNDWKATLKKRRAIENEMNARLQEVSALQDKLVEAETERLYREQPAKSAFQVGDRVRNLTDNPDWIEREGTVVSLGWDIYTIEDDYSIGRWSLNKPGVNCWVNVAWDQTPRQKETNRKGSQNGHLPETIELVPSFVITSLIG